LNRLDLTIEDEMVARAALFADGPDMLEQIEFVKRPLAVNPLYITAGMQNTPGPGNHQFLQQGAGDHQSQWHVRPDIQEIRRRTLVR